MTEKFLPVEIKRYLCKLQELENEISSCEKVEYKRIGEELTKITNSVVQKGHEIERLLQKKILIKQLKEEFRKAILPWMGQSEIMRRALEKPKGYPGDYQTLELIYDNKPISKGIGYFFDQEFLKSELTTAVRSRKDRMVKLLVEFINGSKKDNLKILNLGCGSCRDIKEAMGFLSPNVKVEFYCLDQDEDALRFSEKNLRDKTKNISFKFIKENVLDFFKYGKIRKAKGFDLVYSIGLADYLPNRILRNLLKESFENLNYGGILIVTHKNPKKYIPIREDWLTDWKFIPRDEQAMINLIRDVGINRKQISVLKEPSQIIYFVKISKST